MVFRKLDFIRQSLPRTLTFTSTTTTWLATCFVVVIGAWRHYETSVHPIPFQQEVWIEWMSWIVLFFVQKLLSSYVKEPENLGEPQVRSFWSSYFTLWLAAGTALASQLLSSQRQPAYVSPLITVSTTLLVYYLSGPSDAQTQYKEEISPESGYPGTSTIEGHAKEMIPRLPIPTILNLLACVLLVEYTQFTTTGMVILGGALFLLTRSAAFLLISKLPRQHSLHQASSPEYDAMDCVAMLSVPILALLTILLVIMPPALEVLSRTLLFHAVAQAMWWFATVYLIRLQLVNTVANLDTIGLSAQIALAGTNIQHVGVALAALILSVIQSIVVLRPGPGARKAICILAIAAVLGLWLRQDPRLMSGGGLSKDGHHFGGHPIENLIATSRAHFDTLCAKQSQTLQEAVKEYQRRYGRRPPLGFDQWFSLAQENKFVLIDEFDTFMQSLEPFHGIEPAIIQERIESVVDAQAGRVGVMTFENRNVTMSEGITGLGEKLLSNATWLDIIQYNMTVVVNEWDESMVCSSFDEVGKAVRDAKDSQRLAHGLFDTNVNPLPLIETGKQSGWAATSHACSIYSPSRQNECPQRKLSTPLSFIGNATFSKDVCQNCDLLSEHGLLVSPGNMKVAHELVPIWSASKPSHFHDVLYPSAYYIAVRDQYRPQLDSHWDDKDNKFYWVGTATGGWATEETWPLMQRQRLVLETMNSSVHSVQLLEQSGPNEWSPRFSTFDEISNLFTTRISSVVQCTDEACEAEKEAFGLLEDVPKDSQDAAYSHKFVMDIDGNGFSGRYYRLLQSRSVVVKETILKEWHDDRLIPWVHYVPLSTGYAELPEMARFLAGTEKGLQLSERIARESTAWHNQALRDIDLRLVWLRMLLEFGRVMQPDVTM